MNLLADSFEGLNVAHFRDEEYDDLIAKGVTLPDGDERNEVYHRCEQIVAEQVPWLVISHAKVLVAYTPKLQNFEYRIIGETNLAKAQVLA